LRDAVIFWMMSRCSPVSGVANTVYHRPTMPLLRKPGDASGRPRVLRAHFLGLLGTAAAPASMLLLAISSAGAARLAVRRGSGLPWRLVLDGRGDASATAAGRRQGAGGGGRGGAWRLHASAPILANLALCSSRYRAGGSIGFCGGGAGRRSTGPRIEIATLCALGPYFPQAFGVLIGGYVATAPGTTIASPQSASPPARYAILAVGTSSWQRRARRGDGARPGSARRHHASRDMIVRRGRRPAPSARSSARHHRLQHRRRHRPANLRRLMDRGSPRGFLLVVACHPSGVLTVIVKARGAPQAGTPSTRRISEVAAPSAWRGARPVGRRSENHLS